MGQDISRIPDKFIEWCYRGRRELIRKMVDGEKLSKEALFLGFTRHSPTIVTHGKAGPNGSVKGVGFVPKPEYMESLLSRYMAHIESGVSNGYSKQGLDILLETIYGPQGEEMIDFTKLATLELAKGHTWLNIRDNNEVSMVFFEPPVVSFEVRALALVHQHGVYHEFVNAQHDVYHGPDRKSWNEKPAYIFEFCEIYDNSATKGGFGTLIYKREDNPT